MPLQYLNALWKVLRWLLVTFLIGMIINHMRTKKGNPSKHFTWEELNAPTDVSIRKNLQLLVTNVLDPLREFIQLPVFITSAYRDANKNASVGGVKNSQHMEGKAVDLYIKGVSADYIFNIIQKQLPYDVLIYYRAGARAKFPFIHVSYNEGKNRFISQIKTKDNRNV